MKKLLLKSLLLLCAFIVGSMNGWAAYAWEEVALSDLTSSDIFVIVGTSSAGSFSMSNGNSTTSAPTAAAVTITSGKITSTVGTDIQWKLSGNGTDGYTFYPYNTTEAWLYCTTTAATGSNNNIRVGTGTRKVFKLNTNNYLVSEKPTNESSDRYLCVYNGTDWRGYTTASPATTIKFYKRVEASKSPAGLSYSTSKIAGYYGDSFTEPTLSNPNSLTITYASSDATVAEVDENTGEITLKNKVGSATITASTEGDATHDAGNASYSLYVFVHKGTSASPFNVNEANLFITNTLFNTSSSYYVQGLVSQIGTFIEAAGKLTYYISDDGTTTNQLNVYKGLNLGEAKFASASDLAINDEVTVVGPLTYFNNTTPEINDGNYLYKKGDVTSPTLTVNDITNMDVTTEVATNTLYTTNSNGAVSFESSDETIAKFESNKLKALKPGTATITVNVATDAGNHYAAISKTFKVTVTSKPSVTPAGTVFSLVTNASTLSVGDKIILVSSKTNGSANAMGAQGANNRRGVAVTIANDVITNIPSVQVITLEKTGDKWNFNVGSGYLYATSSSANNIGTREAREDANADATIAIAEGGATITFQGTNTKNIIRHNPNSGNPIFSCYSSNTGNLPFIFRLSTPVSYDIEIGSTGYKTIISAHSATLPSGLTAYKAVSVSAGSIQLTPVASIKAGCAYVLKGTAGNYTLTVTDTPEEPTGNILEVSTESSGNGCYVLAEKGGVVGFYKWTGGSLGAGRAIVPASAVSTAREFLSFDFGDDETTGVNEMKTQKVDNQYFNLAGQRVANPTKGLYIVNGKKVIIK